MQMCCSGVEQRGRLRAASLSAKEGGTDELASQHPVGESGKHTESDFDVESLNQGLNPCPLNWGANSYPLCHRTVPYLTVYCELQGSIW